MLQIKEKVSRVSDDIYRVSIPDILSRRVRNSFAVVGRTDAEIVVAVL